MINYLNPSSLPIGLYPLTTKLTLPLLKSYINANKIIALNGESKHYFLTNHNYI